MPIIEYKCMDCYEVFERIHLSVDSAPSVFCACSTCEDGLAERIMSMPAQIKMADMEKINRRRQRIKEPMWLDTATGKRTPVNP